MGEIIKSKGDKHPIQLIFGMDILYVQLSSNRDSGCCPSKKKRRVIIYKGHRVPLFELSGNQGCSFFKTQNSWFSFKKRGLLHQRKLGGGSVNGYSSPFCRLISFYMAIAPLCLKKIARNQCKRLKIAIKDFKKLKIPKYWMFFRL